jgi:diguanylate cyclase (GGDEF)-like protein/PAS domain S-box-containing protein
MLVGFFVVAGVFTCLLVGEADASKQAERQAVANERRFRDIAEIASDWVWETDRDLRITYVSQQIERSSGTSTEMHLGSPLMNLAALPAQQPGLEQYLEATTEQRSFRDVVCDTSLDSEERRVVRVSGKPFFDDQNRLLGYRGVGSDISAEVHREERIRFLAEHDQLTRLPNRVFFQDRLRDLLHSQRGREQHGVLLALDLDGFKDINDTFGHDVGDALIVAVAERLLATVRAEDVLARLGGDEFAIVQIGLRQGSVEDAELAERLLDAFHTPFHAGGKELAIGVSIGIARFPTDGYSLEDVMKAADLAMYSAKARGRGCFEFFDRAMTRRLHHRKRLETELRRAIENGALEVHFQPQVHLPSGELTGAEALVRWRDPEFGQVPPFEFVPVAEETGLILPLGQWVLESACAEAAYWQSTGLDGRVAVNVSPAQFTHQDLVATVEAALAQTGLPPQRLELEITEGLLMGDTRAAIETLDRLRDMGVQLAIDDFGTGYSSLSYLKRFRVHKVKIDKSFVGDLEFDEDDRRIVHAILMLGQALNLSTIAEGVETPMQSELLTSLGCDQAQGYLYGKPMPADHLRQFWRHARDRRSALVQTAS